MGSQVRAIHCSSKLSSWLSVWPLRSVSPPTPKPQLPLTILRDHNIGNYGLALALHHHCAVKNLGADLSSSELTVFVQSIDAIRHHQQTDSKKGHIQCTPF
jgi:hypothetical protein